MRSRPLWAILALSLLLAFSCRSAPKEGALTLVEAELPPPGPDEIREAQRILSAAGLYEGELDGAITPELRIALVRFQRAHALPRSGTLDPATWQALQREAPPSWQEGDQPQAPPPRLPSAEALLAEEAPLPQPPAGALAAAYAEAHALLEAAEEAPAPEVDPAPRGEGSAAEAEAQAMQRRRAQLFAAEERAFARIVEARKAGGYALLPTSLEEALKSALAAKGLLLRPSAEGLGKEEEAAIRWLQRSLGQEVDGEPSFRLLEALGIDPSSIFVPP